MPNIYNEKLYTTIDNVNTKSYSVSTCYDPIFKEVAFVAKRFPHLSFEEASLYHTYAYGEHLANLQLSEISDANLLPLLTVSIQEKLSFATSALIAEANNNSTTPVISDTYPIATRYIDTNGTYYIERPPFQTEVDYKIGGASSRTKRKLTNIKVWIPWTLFVINPKTQKTAMYFSHKSLTNMEDVYFATYLPNTYQDGSICYSHSISSMPEYNEFSSLSVSQLYAFYINEYFAGAWNSDLSNPWSTVFPKVYTIIRDYFPEDKDSYPMMRKLFDPSVEELLNIFGNKTSYINSIISSIQNNSVKSLAHASAVPLEYCDGTYAHHYILTILSTFSLEEILNLLEEYSSIHTLVTNDSDHPYWKYFKRYFYQYKTNFQHYGSFSSVLETVLGSFSSLSPTNSIVEIPHVLRTFASENGIAAPYNFIDTRLLIINNVSDTSSWSFSLSSTAFDQSYSYIQDNFTPYEYKKLLDRIINDSKIDRHACSNSIYCYDFSTKEIHVIPYSIQTYMDLLNLSINNQLDIVGYINATV